MSEVIKIPVKNLVLYVMGISDTYGNVYGFAKCDIGYTEITSFCQEEKTVTFFHAKGKDYQLTCENIRIEKVKGYTTLKQTQEHHKMVPWSINTMYEYGPITKVVIERAKELDKYGNYRYRYWIYNADGDDVTRIFKVFNLSPKGCQLDYKYRDDNNVKHFFGNDIIIKRIGH